MDLNLLDNAAHVQTCKIGTKRCKSIKVEDF